MKVRTIYFKVREMAPALGWWRAFLECEPAKSFPEWCEFRLGGMYLGLLLLTEGVQWEGRRPCVPVFEFGDDEIHDAIVRAKRLGAIALLEGAAHPDFPSTAAVLADPFGNEFEVTNYHGYQ